MIASKEHVTEQEEPQLPIMLNNEYTKIRRPHNPKNKSRHNFTLSPGLEGKDEKATVVSSATPIIV